MNARAMAACLVWLALPLCAEPVKLSNGRITAEFGDDGLIAVNDLRLARDEFGLAIGGRAIEPGTPVRKDEASRVIYSYASGSWRIDVVYELRAGWDFVSKQIVIRSGPPGRFRLDEVTVFRGAMAEAVRDAYVIARGRPNLGTGDYGAFLRFAGGRGLAVVAQNPFLKVERTGSAFAVVYKPDMDWDLAWGSFEADRGLLGPYRASGRMLPERMLPEWQMGPIDSTPGMDEAEVAAFTGMVRAFLLYRPAKPLNLMVGWCVNDYQIDIATPEGRTEYKRILDQADALGANHVLFAPANSEVSRRDDDKDDWGWEHSLWFGMGQKIRQNQWDPATGEIPSSVREMLDYARGKKLGLVAYVYPVMGFTQNPEWLLGARGTRANLGVRSLQDWLIRSLEAFVKHTGASGFAFDHTFLAYEGTSRYAQWWGWRRVMETLRSDMPEIVIDGRQAYQNYGPWSWLAGSYPHPTSTDEQPESFVSFPDLSLDRVSADRERYTAYRYRNYEFAPDEIVPGFITHQTGRNDDFGRMPEARTRAGQTLLPFRPRDWDYLGWRYSLLSSIAIAGWNNVINMIPARDPEEFKNFSAEDRAFFRKWIDWTAANKETLQHTRTILGQPAIGKIDGTAAIDGDHGFVFLFNPNAGRASAHIPLERGFQVRELYPHEGRVVGSAHAIEVELNGHAALVLALGPPQRAEAALRIAAADDGREIRTRVAGNVAAGTIRVPQRVFEQLEARRKAWPISWTAEDYRSTWLVPHRLLLYVQFAEPDDRWNAAVRIDGRAVDVMKAYASVRANPRNFTGFYADVSLLAADVEHRIEVTLPEGLKPGQFLGVFLENVEEQ